MASYNVTVERSKPDTLMHPSSSLRSTSEAAETGVREGKREQRADPEEPIRSYKEVCSSEEKDTCGEVANPCSSSFEFSETCDKGQASA